jgi:hypothetical protein
MASMRRDLNWECYQSLDPRRHGGKYVVIVGGRLIGSGQDLARLLRLARKRRPRETPFVARMRNPKRLCVYPGRLDA